MTDAVLLEARETTRRVARTFAIACRVLPRELRDDVYRLYLVYRTLDDLVDERRPEAEQRLEAVERWARGTTMDGAHTLETELLSELASRHPLPRHALHDFCAGMRFDLAEGTNQSEADLDVYCYQVAGTVGVVMASMLGTKRPAEKEAAALGMAMQRTNILRDIDEDWANGRVFVAAETVARCGGSLLPGRRRQLLEDQIPRADALYDEGISGIPALACGNRAIAAAAGMYREILREIERQGYGREPGRAVVSGRRKLVIATRRAARAR